MDFQCRIVNMPCNKIINLKSTNRYTKYVQWFTSIFCILRNYFIFQKLLLLQYYHTRDLYIVPYRHNFEFFLFPRFFSYSCLSRPSGRWLAQATVREKSWKEEKIQNYGDKEQCSISSVPLGNSISYFYFFNRAMEKLEKITNYPILIVNEEIYTVHIFNFHKFKTYT